MAPAFPQPRFVGCYFGKCDFCQEENLLTCNLMVSIKGNYGWISCENCLEDAEKARQFNIYSQEKIISEFGENFRVKRSSGEYETDWKIEGYGYKMNGDILIPVEKRDGTVTKKIPLQMLREWN